MLANSFYFIDNSGKCSELATIEDAINKDTSNGYVWYSFNRLAADELLILKEPLGLHSLSIEDCLDDNQVPKIDEFPTNTFVLFNSFNYKNKQLSIDEINFFIGKNFLISVNRIDNEKPFFSDVLRMINQSIVNIKNGPAFLMHILIDFIVDKKIIGIEAIQDEIDNAEDKLLDNYADFDAKDVQRLRRDLLSLRKSLFYEREILLKICRKDSPFIHENATYNFKDIYDHIAKFYELSETLRDIVKSLMEMHLSMMNNEMSKSANQTNNIVRRLTYITTIFMPLTLLAGIGGMSEWSMMTGPENWKISYPLFLLLMAVIGIANYYLLTKLDKKKH